MLNEALYLAMAGKGGTKPTGNINITDTQVTDVAAYATAQVVDANLVAENIKDGVEVLGITGTFKGGGSTPPETPTDALLFYSPNEIGLRTNNRLKN